MNPAENIPIHFVTAIIEDSEPCQHYPCHCWVYPNVSTKGFSMALSVPSASASSVPADQINFYIIKSDSYDFTCKKNRFFIELEVE